jgi:predicted Zn-dependent peptidase
MKNYFQSKLIQIIQKFCLFLCFLWIALGGLSLSPVWALTQGQQNQEPTSIQPYLDRVIDRVTEFTLDNGLKFIVLEDHKAPIVSFATYANVGGANEPEGKTGVAHFLEHLAFKGTQDIGTIDYGQEKVILDELDQLFDQLQNAKKENDPQKISQIQAEFTQLEEKANQYVKQNEYGQIVETAGGVGLNAVTSADYTMYFYSFPANKLELWMSLESERFLDPVFREFYKEKEVILEERRMRTENSPIGQMIEAFLDKSFTLHPYKRPVIGFTEDLQNLTRQDVMDFFEEYYTPNNLIMTVVGDVNPTEVKNLARTYFGRFPKKAKPPQLTVVEPPQREEKQITLNLVSQPWYLEGYHSPGLNHPDQAVYAIISGLMSSGRTSRLYRSLVEEKQVALQAQGFSGFPGDKYPNLTIFYGLTAPSATVEDVAIALRGEIERLKNEPVTKEELERIKNQARAKLLSTLSSKSSLARLLAEYEAKTGNWRNLFAQLDLLAKVTPQDIQRVAKATFTPENRTVGKILPVE